MSFSLVVNILCAIILIFWIIKGQLRARTLKNNKDISEKRKKSAHFASPDDDTEEKE